MKKGKWVFILVIVGFFLFFLLTGPSGLIRVVKLKLREKELKAEIKKIKVEIELIRQRIRRLEKDTAFIKFIAREKLNMVDSIKVHQILKN